MIKQQWLHDTKIIYGVGVVISLFLSFLIPYHHAILNPDAICYLVAANTIATAGLKAGMHACAQADWPFYPWLIHLGVKAFALSYANTAYLIDSLLSCVTVVTFVAIVKILGGRGRVLWFALAVILLAHDFNAARAYIVRDHGFFAFYLLSLWCYLCYVSRPRLMVACAFSVSLLLASLFRIEGIVFLVTLPFLLWFDVRSSYKARFYAFSQLNVLVILGCGIACLWILFPSENTHAYFGRLLEIPYQLQHGFAIISEKLHLMKLALEQHVLNAEGARDAKVILFLLFPIFYGINIVSTLSLLYTLLFIYTQWQRALLPPAKMRLVIYGYLFINVVLTFFFLLQRGFLSKRYLIALSLTLMLWIPFGIERFYERQLSKKNYAAIALLVAAMIATAWSGIWSSRVSKAYVQQAGYWLASVLPQNKKVYINNVQLAYYINKEQVDLLKLPSSYQLPAFLQQGKWQQFDYLALKVSAKEQEMWQPLLAELNAAPIKIFGNGRDQVLIYQIK